MPCQSCKLFFKVKPCKHPTGNINICLGDYSIIYKSTLKDMDTYDLTGYIKEVYRALHKSCKCSSCLVKGVCDVSKICDDYYTELDKLKATSTKVSFITEEEFRNNKKIRAAMRIPAILKDHFYDKE